MDSRVSWKNVAVILVIVVIVGGLFVFVAQRLMSGVKTNVLSGQETTSSKGVGVSDTETAGGAARHDGIATGKIFYSGSTLNNNIFSYDTKTGETVQWTNYPQQKEDADGNLDGPFHDLDNIKVIDENTLGFGGDNILADDSGEGIYTLDLRTKMITEKKRLDKDMQLSSLDFTSTDRFVYAVVVDDPEGMQLWEVSLMENGSVKNIQERTKTGNVSVEAQFSPDGKYVAAELSGEGVGSNVFLYNLANGSRQVIADVWSPVWIDNVTIGYMGANKDRDGNLPSPYYYYEYTINTQTVKSKTEAGAPKFDASPLKGEGKMLYSVYDDAQVWLYDLNTQTRSKVLDNAISGVWVTPTVIAVKNVVKTCNDEAKNYRDQCGFSGGDYDVVSIDIFDLASNTKIGTMSGDWSEGDEITSLYEQ